MSNHATLSEAQLGIWLGHQRSEEPALFNAAEFVMLEGPLDVPAFSAALQETLREAEALHVAFAEVRGKPCRVQTPFSEFTLERIVLPETSDDALCAHAASLAARPFELEQGPLFRHQLVKLGAQRHAWLHVAHHIVLDGYGFNAIARRVAEHYHARLTGSAESPSPFTPLDPVVHEDRAYQASEARALDRTFWLSELGARRAATFGSVDSPGRALRGRYAWSSETFDSLQALARELRVHWVELLLAGVGMWVGEQCALDSFVLGLPVMLRLGTRAARTPCMAMNIAPLPIDLAPGDSLSELSQRLRRDLGRQRRHQRYRYEHLQEAMAPGERAFGPVVNVMPFEFPRAFGNCQASLLPVCAGPVQDLALSFRPHEGGLELAVDGHEALFTGAELAALAEDLHAHVQGLLREPVHPRLSSRVPEAAFDDVPPAPCPIHALREHARKTPGQTALVSAHHSFSYQELDRAALRCAAWLRAEGVLRDDLVAVDLPRSPRAIVTLLGALYAGAAYVALDPAHPRARRQAVLERARPRALVSDPGQAYELPEGTLNLTLLDASFAHAAQLDQADLPLAGERAYVAFTSGTSGEPKGVVIGTSALSHFVAAAREAYGFTCNDRVLQFAPLAFDASVEEIFVTLSAGAALVLRDDELESPESFLASVEQKGITVLDLPTAFWHELSLGVAERGLVLPPRVRLVIIGGEAASPERIRGWNRHVQSVRLLNTYGPTEATVVATYADIGGDFAADDVPIGRPLAGVHALVCDERGRVLDEPRSSGELYLSGKTLASGYLEDHERKSPKFVRLRGRGRAYRTGDLVERDESGLLLYRGRVDEELKISGVRIAPAEVERTLERYRGVRGAVVLGALGGAGAKHLVAHVEGDAETLEPAALRAFVAEHLPTAMVPSRIEVHATLPRTSNGKLDRKALQSRRSTTHVESALLDEHQAKVVAAWRDVLGISEVTLDDDFFALGGHSLQVIQLANRLSTSQRELRVSQIFRNPTPRKQARLVSAEPCSTERVSFRPWPITLGELTVRESAQPGEREPRRVLLTGTTGFVGAHLLWAWLEHSSSSVVCLVRGKSDVEARARLTTAAHKLGMDLTRFASRIEVVALDLGDERLTADVLERRLPHCQAMFHCAAQVSLTRDYESLARVNVLATRELLLLAARLGATFHYVSSVATAPLDHTLVPEQLFPLHEGLVDGYQRSKWHGEALCGEAGALGLPVAVYRLGRVVAPRTRPVIHDADLAWRIARTATRVSAWPDLPFREPWLPADEAGTVMVELALRGSAEAPTAVYHLTHTGSVSLSDFRAALSQTGFALPVVSVAEWVASVRAHGDDEDRSTAAFFEMNATEVERAPNPTRDFACSRLLARLPMLQPRPFDAETLAAFCEHAQNSGFLGAKR